MSKTRRIAAWILIALVGGAMIASATMKLMGGEEVVEGFRKFNLADWRIPIGVVELLAGLMLIIPQTHSLGLLLLTAYLGGAIATHLQQTPAAEAMPAAVILALLWIGGLLRHSELLISFWHPRSSRNSV